MSFRAAGIGATINRAITGSGRSLLEQALYPKTDAGNRTIGPLLYGAFYSGGTYLGYPGNYRNRKGYTSTNVYNLQMPGYSKYSRRKNFSYRWSSWYNKRVFSRKYRRYIYVHQRRY